jgi:hypothetical protein
MLQQQETVTEQLVTVIQIIQLGRGTGLLIAKRGEGIIVEEGSISFANGHVTEVRVGRYNGSEAFNRLSTWEKCVVSFVSQVSSHTTTPIPTTAPLPPTSGQLVAGELIDSEDQRHTLFSAPLPERAHTPHMGVEVPSLDRSLKSALYAVERMGFSRTHRQLLLIIDGKRSINDLARLVGHDVNNVQALLRDLEQAALIRLSNLPMP